MKRIIYERINEFQFRSKHPIKIKEGYAVPVYDLSNKTFKVLGMASNDVLASGSGSSHHKILIKIKKALQALGANFNTEKRYKDYGLQNNNTTE